MTAGRDARRIFGNGSSSHSSAEKRWEAGWAWPSPRELWTDSAARYVIRELTKTTVPGRDSVSPGRAHNGRVIAGGGRCEKIDRTHPPSGVGIQSPLNQRYSPLVTGLRPVTHCAGFWSPAVIPRNHTLLLQVAVGPFLLGFPEVRWS